MLGRVLGLVLGVSLVVMSVLGGHLVELPRLQGSRDLWDARKTQTQAHLATKGENEGLEVRGITRR